MAPRSESPTEQAPTTRRHATVSRGDRQRQLILDAAEEALGRIPAPKLSVKDITETAGINRSNFYFYFASKEEVLGQLFTAALTGWESRAGGFLRRTGEPHLDYFLRLDDAAFATWVEHADVMIAGMQSASIATASENEWNTLVRRYNSQVAGQLTSDLQAGLVSPHSDDHLGMITLLTDMATYAYYQDRLLKPAPEQTARTRENIKRVWLGAWGIDVGPG